MADDPKKIPPAFANGPEHLRSLFDSFWELVWETRHDKDPWRRVMPTRCAIMRHLDVSPAEFDSAMLRDDEVGKELQLGWLKIGEWIEARIAGSGINPANGIYLHRAFGFATAGISKDASLDLPGGDKADKDIAEAIKVARDREAARKSAKNYGLKKKRDYLARKNKEDYKIN